jgi:hypothetical protein
VLCNTLRGSCGCEPNCEGRECGFDGCEGQCLPGCGDFEFCDEAIGVCQCLPNCTDRVCGPDGCGSTCPPGCGIFGTCVEETGICDGECSLNSAWGSECMGVDLCRDGSVCWSIVGMPVTASICAAGCRRSEDCPEIAPGEERCILSTEIGRFCAVECVTSDDCPCDQVCRELLGTIRLCYP